MITVTPGHPLDGKPDVVVTNSQTNLVTIFPNAGAGALGMGMGVPLTYPNPGRLTTGDFNGDNRPDIALINFNANGKPVLPILMVLLNTTM